MSYILYEVGWQIIMETVSSKIACITIHFNLMKIKLYFLTLLIF